MRTHQSEHAAEIRTAPGFVDLTDEVQRALIESGISNGQVTVFSPETLSKRGWPFSIRSFRVARNSG
jgi:thiamine phosphate synthase YjbQ (UPF0047 family)